MLSSTHITRRRTRRVFIGPVPVGGGSPIAVQSMTKTDTRDVPSTIGQILLLQRAGCEIIRLAVPDMEAAQKLGKIKQGITIPLVADIHFDYRLALEALEQGVDGLRLNPGNMGNKKNMAQVAKTARQRKVPIRVGVNSGSLEKKLLQKYGAPTPEALVESALSHVRLLEDQGFDLIKISLKASDPVSTIAAYRKISRLTDYPLHLGITEAGPPFPGGIKSAVGLGILLHQGIGDTVRVSLTADPCLEVRAAYHILRALRLRARGVEIISCPLCGRSKANLTPIVQEIEARLADWPEPMQVAIMGCEVNGPGEARGADVGIAAGRGVALLFRKGKVVRRLKESEMVAALIAEAEAIRHDQERKRACAFPRD
ncbi:MAG: flavodoxin-dependent (E)-4-hydroxy-3-methylbut-2-enyl-diphosphate synthase [Deltaproteobacteria bacterium]|nr:flavodoxin-dependent (E)-4-hydroxy-3-methylbut-2-enyl-diphosphate synthase [Deltaproteobacteria bacterium]